MTDIVYCPHCGDFKEWICSRWLCPTCDKKLIERLKYTDCYNTRKEDLP